MKKNVIESTARGSARNRVEWERGRVREGTTLQQAIACLNESSLQIVLVVSQEGRMLGTLTDGDIRRGLLLGMNLQSVIDPIIHREPLVVPPAMSRESVLALMKANKIHQLPIVDETRHLVGLHLWDELMVPTARVNQMVIMAGGRGTRLGLQTKNCPKPLLPVGGKPMLERIIERARDDGISHFLIAIQYLGHMIEEYFGDGRRWQVDIRYLHEETPMGTAGGLGLINPQPEDAFLVSNGDVLTDIHYSEMLDFHCRQGAVATMAVRLHEWQHPFGVVRTEGVDIIGFEEKPITRSHINAGVYVLEPGALNVLSAAEHCDMPTLFGRLREKGMRTVVYPMHELWFDVGREDDLMRAHEHHRTQ